MGKKHKIIKCLKCRCNNDLTLMLDTNDYDVDSYRENVGYIYCVQCGNCIEIELK